MKNLIKQLFGIQQMFVSKCNYNHTEKVFQVKYHIEINQLNSQFEKTLGQALQESVTSRLDKPCVLCSGM